jgi:radical SAM-linked protein
MVSDPQQQPVPAAAADRPRVQDKARVRFRKGGDLRLVSHRDLMKCFERALRRARLPVHHSQGFHPMPRMVFGMPLGLGIIGLEEVLELEFDEPIEPEELHRRLAGQMPPGLTILSVHRISPKSAVQVRRAGYCAPVPEAHLAGLPARIESLLAKAEIWVERTRPAPRRLDLRPYLSELRLSDQRLEMLLWVTPNGAARPEEILALLGLADLTAAGVPLERHLLELADEIHDPGLAAEAHPPGRQATAPAPHQLAPSDVAERPARPTPLVAGPLSFDS